VTKLSIALISVMTGFDCTSLTFDMTPATTNFPLQVGVGQTISPDVYAQSEQHYRCMSLLQVQMDDGSTKPVFINNWWGFPLQIKPTKQSELGDYDLRVKASYWDGIQANIESAWTYLGTIKVCNKPTSIETAANVVNQFYEIGSGLKEVNISQYVGKLDTLPSMCNTEFTHVLDPATKPGFVSVVPTGSSTPDKIQINTSSASDGGEYHVTLLTSEILGSQLTHSYMFMIVAYCKN
jgi:hypothetical protein